VNRLHGGQPVSILGRGREFFSSSPRPDRLWIPPSFLSSGYRDSFSGCKVAGWGGGEGEADHSPPSSSEVKNAWSYASTPLYVFMAWYLVKPRETLSLIHSRCNLTETNGIVTEANATFILLQTAIEKLKVKDRR
jgi:hypothetical protein